MIIAQADEIIMNIDEFPFGSLLSFRPLIDYWRQEATQPQEMLPVPLDLLEEHFVQTPELAEPILDLKILETHRESLELLLRPFFPTFSKNPEIKAVSKPFSVDFFYTSQPFQRLIGEQTSLFPEGTSPTARRQALFWRMLYAYKYILNTLYQLPLTVDQPQIIALPHPQTGLDRYYKINGYGPFMRLEHKGRLPKLAPDTLDHLVDNFHNLDLWMQHLPPRKFTFTGLHFYNMVDVTVEEATARLERLTLNQRGGITEGSFEQLQRELSILFRLPDIRLGLATLQGDNQLNWTTTNKGWNSLLIRSAKDFNLEDIQRSPYGRAIREGKYLLIEDLARDSSGSRIEKALLKMGVSNWILSPLYYQERLVGILEITSPNIGDIDHLSSHKLKRVLPFFARVAHENRERFENRVQRAIKENYTAIHPAVEWRFREAAIQSLDHRQSNRPAEPGSILFEGVYPLYGAADIRGSSELRNASIRDDLIAHMQEAGRILQLTRDSLPLVSHRELAYTLERKIRRIEEGMGPGEESEAMEFLREEVNPLFRHLHASYPELQPLFQSFMERTETGTELLHQKRAAYESSLQRINETISNALLRDQQELQRIFPHYFEKYQTDGVEYNIYIGPSLVKDRPFSPIYLRNLRLYQLIAACEIARKIADLQPELEVPLSITQLILVHSAPVNIRFRIEEKQFDVDGAYNVRYEIMKKRIDKAVIKGTDERITQPKRIAVIYTSEKERTEYARYFEYLLAHEYIEPSIEYFDLEELQGVQGLKAARLAVALGE
ncbi:GAF domain-containing protein [Flavilitoribacter nigricans]|uniref:GAF domain-containing protein n=1 Tax=Flavilitoribacter nigricans TaxID=70997 RepID=UPI00117AFF02|nr:GAF domain-containing protein [Flavilitoribacter nigricans]